MKFESPSRKTEKLDLGAFFESKLAELSPEMKIQAEKLKRLGFDVDDNCRVRPEAFMGQVPIKELKDDLTLAKSLKSKFEKSSRATPEKKAQKATGEALEVAKTSGVNSHWFGGRFIAIRSSEYDDFCGNKVDNLIFDTITREPLAAIDATTDQAAKLKDEKEIIKKILDGADVKYGYALEVSKEAPGYKAVKKANQKLPYFMISFGPEELESMMRDLAGGVESDELLAASKRLLTELKQQAEAFSQHSAVKPEIKAAYGRFLKIFESFKKSL